MCYLLASSGGFNGDTLAQPQKNKARFSVRTISDGVLQHMTKASPIIAIATAPSSAAIGIIRLSGAGIDAILKALFPTKTFVARKMALVNLTDENGENIDSGLLVRFWAPHSFTGEDMLEWHGHGGKTVLLLAAQRFLQAGASYGLHWARAGEFSERAFLSGKLDLTQAEAISDLISAQSKEAVLAANRSLHGAFSQRSQDIARQCFSLRAQVEARIDFADDETGALPYADLAEQIARAQKDMISLLQQTQQGQKLRDGLRVEIIGAPNVGKSSLLNALADEELAIVSPQAGTTRDRISANLTVQGLTLHINDGAGIRDSQDEIENMGIARMWQALPQADVVLLVVSCVDLAATSSLKTLANKIELIAPAESQKLLVWNKADLLLPSSVIESLLPSWNRFVISAKTGVGIDDLKQALVGDVFRQTQPVFLARARHLLALQASRQHLEAAQTYVKAHVQGVIAPLELLAEELRLAQKALDEITGQSDVEDMLGAIFSQFCIGK